MCKQGLRGIRARGRGCGVNRKTVTVFAEGEKRGVRLEWFDVGSGEGFSVVNVTMFRNGKVSRGGCPIFVDSRETAAKLAPILAHFAATGELCETPPDPERVPGASLAELESKLVELFMQVGTQGASLQRTIARLAALEQQHPHAVAMVAGNEIWSQVQAGAHVGKVEASIICECGHEYDKHETIGYGTFRNDVRCECCPCRNFRGVSQAGREGAT